MAAYGSQTQVVRDAGAGASARRRVPPVLDVALDELARRRAQQMLAGEVAASQGDRHHVLELVAEPVGPARLVERGPCPHPAGERLVEQPGIQHHVERAIGRSHLHDRQNVVPAGCGRPQGHVDVGRPMANDQRARLVDGRSLAEQQNTTSARAPGRSSIDVLQRAARVEPGADMSRERPRTLEGRGVIERAVAPDELRAVGRAGRLAPAQVGERDPAAELRMPRVAGEQRARPGVDLGDDVGRGRGARRAEDPLDVRRHAQPAQPARAVLEREPARS